MEETPFKKFFIQLTDLYLKPEWTWNDFSKLQVLHADIITARNTNYYSTEPSPIDTADYELLNHMARYLMGDMRAVLNRKEGSWYG